MLFSTLFSGLCLSGLAQAVAISSPAAVESRATDDDPNHYDAIVVGGGPSGLSALSGLARVRRKAILIDSGEYRNNATRHMHDVIGLDGITGQYFRWLAREKLAYYDTVTMVNGTVTSATLQNTTTSTGDVPSYTARVTYPSGEEAVLTARSMVLATGLRDLIPGTPGLQENWGKAVFWCPWCDGHEHADQPLGILADLADVPGLVREVSTLNTDVVAFVNGTDTQESRDAAAADFGAGWDTYLEARNVTVYNQTLASITRLRDGLNASADPSLPTVPEYDLFRVDLDDGTSVERAALFTDFPDEQRSDLAESMGVSVEGGRLAGVQAKGYLTNLPLVYAVGDNNIDNSTNVPHAMYSGKRAAVYLHVALARQESAAEIAAAGNTTADALATRSSHEMDHRDVWERMNGPPGDIFHAGSFEGEI